MSMLRGIAMVPAALLALAAPAAWPQAASPPGCANPPFSPAPLRYIPAEVMPDGRAAFRLCAPDAREVLLLSPDMAGIVPIGYPPGQPAGLAMTRGDFVYATVAPARRMLDRFHIAHVYRETGGGHTWLNWREYLADFAPRLFR